MRSKSWDEFAQPGAPQLDFVFTVCDNAAGEMCPVWPGQPMTAHWGVEDPAAVDGSDTGQWLAFRKAFRELESRIKLFTSLPIRSLDRIRLQQRLRGYRQVARRRRSGLDDEKILAEALGALLLTACVVGSGIMAERLAGGNTARRTAGEYGGDRGRARHADRPLGPISGAHFNPVITAVAFYQRQIGAKTAAAYSMTQFVGMLCRRHAGERHVRAAAGAVLHAHAQRRRAMALGVRGDRGTDPGGISFALCRRGCMARRRCGSARPTGSRPPRRSRIRQSRSADR